MNTDLIIALGLLPIVLLVVWCILNGIRLTRMLDEHYRKNDMRSKPAREDYI